MRLPREIVRNKDLRRIAITTLWIVRGDKITPRPRGRLEQYRQAEKICRVLASKNHRRGDMLATITFDAVAEAFYQAVRAPAPIVDDDPEEDIQRHNEFWEEFRA